MMKTSSTGIALIKRFESFRRTAYRCPSGYLTIGYGHVLRAAENLPMMDEAYAETLLITDVRIAERAVRTMIGVALNQNQFDALVSFTFNLGAGTLQRSTLRSVLNRGDFDTAPTQLMRFIWGGGRKLPGLMRRRAAESALFQGFPPVEG